MQIKLAYKNELIKVISSETIPKVGDTIGIGDTIYIIKNIHYSDLNGKLDVILSLIGYKEYIDIKASITDRDILNLIQLGF